MSDGRWQPGQSGNPSGRPPGSGEVAKLRASIAEKVPEILAKLTELAAAGDVQAARLVLDRVLPTVKPVELPLSLALAEGGLSEQARQMLSAATTGALAPDQAASLISALAAVAKISETAELLRRVEALEESAAARRRA
jgi:hypothetical protein